MKKYLVERVQENEFTQGTVDEIAQIAPFDEIAGESVEDGEAFVAGGEFLEDAVEFRVARQ